MKPMLTALTALLILSLAAPADAMRRGGGGDNAVPQQRAKLKAEWAQARAAGGYGNPISGLLGLFEGDTDRLIQPPISGGKKESVLQNFGIEGLIWRRSTE